LMCAMPERTSFRSRFLPPFRFGWPSAMITPYAFPVGVAAFFRRAPTERRGPLRVRALV